VRAAGIESVTRIIGRGIAEQIFSQLDGKRKINPENTGHAAKKAEPVSRDKPDRAGQSTLSHFR